MKQTVRMSSRAGPDASKMAWHEMRCGRAVCSRRAGQLTVTSTLSINAVGVQVDGRDDASRHFTALPADQKDVLEAQRFLRGGRRSARATDEAAEGQGSVTHEGSSLGQQRAHLGRLDGRTVAGCCGGCSWWLAGKPRAGTRRHREQARARMVGWAAPAKGQQF